MQSPFASGAFEQYPKFPDESQQITLLDWIVALEARVMFPVAEKLPVTLNFSDGIIVAIAISESSNNARTMILDINKLIGKSRLGLTTFPACTAVSSMPKSEITIAISNPTLLICDISGKKADLSSEIARGFPDAHHIMPPIMISIIGMMIPIMLQTILVLLENLIPMQLSPVNSQNKTTPKPTTNILFCAKDTSNR